MLLLISSNKPFLSLTLVIAILQVCNSSVVWFACPQKCVDTVVIGTVFTVGAVMVRQSLTCRRDVTCHVVGMVCGRFHKWCLFILHCTICTLIWNWEWFSI